MAAILFITLLSALAKGFSKSKKMPGAFGGTPGSEFPCTLFGGFRIQGVGGDL
jgi:hypothetical protein